MFLSHDFSFPELNDKVPPEADRSLVVPPVFPEVLIDPHNTSDVPRSKGMIGCGLVTSVPTSDRFHG